MSTTEQSREIKIKAIFLPVNAAKQVLIQDREGHKPPRYGFFGGSVEAGETIFQGLKREVKEELDIDIKESEVEKLGVYKEENYFEIIVVMHVFVYWTEIQEHEYVVLEGESGKYYDLSEALELTQKHSSPADVKVIKDLTALLTNNQFTQ